MVQGRAAGIGLMALLAIGLFAFWGTRPFWSDGALQGVQPMVTSPVRPASGPAQTAWGKRLWQGRASWVSRHPLTNAEQLGTPVLLTHALSRPHAVSRKPDVRAGQALPTADEAPLPRGAATQALEQLLQAEHLGQPNDALESTFLDAARTARLDPTDAALIADPWRALVALEAERRRSSRAAREGELEATGRWLHDLAGAVVQAHPSDPVADHARLYLLEVLSRPDWDTRDGGRLDEAALEALVHSSDALVRATALHHVRAASEHAEELLPALDGMWSIDEPDPWLAAAGADHAVAVGDPVAARTWLDRLGQAVEQACDGALDKATCRAWRTEIRWSRAQQDGIEGISSTGSDDVLAAAWRCQVWRRPLGAGSVRVSHDADGWHLIEHTGEADPSFVSDCLIFEAQGLTELSAEWVLQQDG